ncbi:MAG: SRPBCC domain-containing protein [Planctomycetes bacterium]|nr:SRPBCC domain-containing protein [Planctomycetota bacterium]MBI3843164.1 SRPBCC domain-containing protein [Planctomycetota bacterium]
MTFSSSNRREFAVRLASIFSGLGVAGTVFGSTATPALAALVSGDEISHTAEAIHHEVVFKANRKRIYEALTDTAQFDKVVKLSAAAKSGMKLGSKPTEIAREVGGAFSLFGGYISGRHVELVPNERIVQAWRTGSWDPGLYSIARFELKDQDSGTKLVFDHVGFPVGQAEHLADGWKTNYWEPLEKSLA